MVYPVTMEVVLQFGLLHIPLGYCAYHTPSEVKNMLHVLHGQYSIFTAFDLWCETVTF